MVEGAKIEKHVIFLGAGASMGSGYPSAEELRLLLTSAERLTDYLIRRFNADPSNHTWIYNSVRKAREPYERGLALFRSGGFATVDEFCFLTNGLFPQEVRAVKTYMCIVLAYAMPEVTFHKSEYYRFCQKLFQSDLKTLRPEITVLTYNYDPYLEFLMDRFFQIRNRAGDPDHPVFTPSSAVSGFSPFGRPIDEESGFALLKLHGSISFLNQFEGGHCAPLSMGELMSDTQRDFPGKIFNWNPTNPGPVIFPWEVFENTRLIPKAQCKWNLPSGLPDGDRKGCLHDLMAAVWRRARTEVQTADKISFVGLSMHSYLTDGLAYLFGGREMPFRWVVANPAAPTPTTGVAKEISRALHKIAPKAFNLKNSDPRCVPSFREFIETQM